MDARCVAAAYYHLVRGEDGVFIKTSCCSRVQPYFTRSGHLSLEMCVWRASLKWRGLIFPVLFYLGLVLCQMSL